MSMVELMQNTIKGLRKENDRLLSELKAKDARILKLEKENIMLARDLAQLEWAEFQASIKL